MQTSLLDIAETDNAVLMGRSGQWLLRGIPHVLRVRVIAPFGMPLASVGPKHSRVFIEQLSPDAGQSLLVVQERNVSIAQI